jgi:hypothetical protein
MHDMLISRAWNEELIAYSELNRDSPIPLLLDLLVKCAPIPLSHLSHGALLSKDLPRGAQSPSERNKISGKTTPFKEAIKLSKILDLFAESANVL